MIPGTATRLTHLEESFDDGLERSTLDFRLLGVGLRIQPKTRNQKL